jgi:WXXGXW repeat (2 copies)
MKKLLPLLLLAGTSLFASPRVFVGIGLGAPPPPRIAYAPPSPDPGYSWVDGYWYPAGRHYAWRAGYWVRPPYAGARWYGPRYYGGRYYRGYWRR